MAFVDKSTFVMDIRNHTFTELIGKSDAGFKLADIIRFVRDNGIRMVNFMYPAADGRLKTLNFTLHSEEYLISVLTCGERVDGSSLFPFIEAGNSDLYVVPRLSTAFIDPFAELPTLCFLCAYFDKDGKRLECSPEYTLHKAMEKFTEKTGMRFEAMGELEYYVSAPEDEQMQAYPATDQKGYHESAPFAKFNDFRTECMYYIMLAGGKIKYGHSEVGTFRADGKIWEQNEIEFLPVEAEQAADSLMIAKWIIRNLAYRYGLEVSFAPKIAEGKAGSGLHIHMRLMKDGRNMLLDENGKISDIARRAIAGLMELATSITAFGNTNPTSYLRLVPHQEAPTNVCWGDRNRSVLVRIPLGWTSGKDMFSELNPDAYGDPHPASAPGVKPDEADRRESCADTVPADSGRLGAVKQTMEIRSADCSADIYQLLSALSIACSYGLSLSPEKALEIAARTYVDVDIHKAENESRAKRLEHLPDSCMASAASLEAQRDIYEADGIFRPEMTDAVIRRLCQFDDLDLRDRLRHNKNLELELVRKFFWC